jgi:hypothetical protein
MAESPARCSSRLLGPLPGEPSPSWQALRVLVPTVAVRLYRPVALALDAAGIPAAPVFAEFGMPDPATTGWDVRLPLPQIAGVWDRLLQVTGDGSFALRAAEHIDLTVCDVITFLEGNAKT